MNLTPEKRKAMPKSEFAGPGTSFPVNDPTHQRLAIGGATRAYNAGNIGKGQETHIQQIARTLLNREMAKRLG